jgi:Ion channel
MEIISMVLLLALIVKLFAVIQSLFWIVRNGKIFSESIQAWVSAVSLSGKDFRDLYFGEYKSTNADMIFPFGFNDLNLTELAQSNLKIRYIPNFAKNIKFFFKGWVLTVFSSIYVLLLASFTNTLPRNFIPIEYHEYILQLIFLILLVLCSFQCFILAFSYSTMGGYAWHFHLINPNDSKLADEIKVFLTIGIRLILSATSCLFFFQISQNILTGELVSAKYGSGFSCLTLFFQCMYFAVVTLTTTGFGDIHPVSGIGQLIVGLILLIGFSMISLILAFILKSNDI